MKTRAMTVLLYLLLALVKVHSQTAPNLTFMGNNIPNHSYVDLTTVTGGDNILQCNTDLDTCCTGDQADRGNWYFPNGSELSFWSRVSKGFSVQRVVLFYRGSGGASGIYRCDIETVAVNNDDGTESIYVGLYITGGDVTIPGGMNFTLDSDLNGDSTQFTLTCISTGGPATTVTWTRDSETVSGGMTVFNNAVTAQYTHTLTVTGRLGGQYQCTVTNNKPSTATAQFSVKVASAPSNLTAIQEGLTGIRVSWIPPTPLGDTTGYRIYYSGGSSGSEDVSGGSTDNHLLTGLQNGASYNIYIVGTSDHFPSQSMEYPNMTELVLAPPVMPVISVGATTPTTISLSWNTGGSVVDSYEVMWERDTSGECPYVDEDSATITGGSISYTISGLEEDSNYTITVTATNAATGSTVSLPVMELTREAVPSTPPTSLSVSDITSTNITVQWGPVDCIHRNGDITGYSVKYGAQGTRSTQTLKVSGGATTEIAISGLKASTTYFIEVAAVNSAGTGVYSHSTSLRTSDVLGTPINFKASVDEREVTFAWFPSSSSVLIIGYIMTCTPSHDLLPQSFPQSGTHRVSGFSPQTSYNCSVTAYTSQTVGPPATVVFTTEEDNTFFNIGLAGFIVCTKWRDLSRSLKLADITRAVEEELSASCQCQITNDTIDEESFACSEASPNSVTYQARLSGTSERDSASFISLIEDWVSTGPTIHVRGVLMWVGEECSTAISDLSEGVCSSSEAQTSTGAIVGGVTAVSVVLVVAVAVVVIIALIMRHRYGHISLQTAQELSMADLSTAKKGETTIDKNVSYNLFQQSSTGHMGEGKIGGGGGNNQEYEVITVPESHLPSQVSATSTGGGGGEERVYEEIPGGQ